MKQAGATLPVDGLGTKEEGFQTARSHNNGSEPGIPGNVSQLEMAAAQAVEKIKFAIHAPLKNFSPGGWQVTDTYIIFSGKTK